MLELLLVNSLSAHTSNQVEVVSPFQFQVSVSMIQRLTGAPSPILLIVSSSFRITITFLVCSTEKKHWNNDDNTVWLCATGKRFFAWFNSYSLHFWLLPFEMELRQARDKICRNVDGLHQKQNVDNFCSAGTAVSELLKKHNWITNQYGASAETKKRSS